MKRTIEFTEEEILEYVRGFTCVGEQSYSVGEIQGILHNAHLLLKDKKDGIESYGVSMGWDKPKELSQVVAPKPIERLYTYLPRPPSWLLQPRLGWVYIGTGKADCDGSGTSEYLVARECDGWDYSGRWDGSSPFLEYAIRWDAPKEVWHRFGRLSPAEGGGWIPHTPGEKMPDYAPLVLDYLYKDGNQWLNYAKIHSSDCTGWRPALEIV